MTQKIWFDDDRILRTQNYTPIGKYARNAVKAVVAAAVVAGVSYLFWDIAKSNNQYDALAEQILISRNKNAACELLRKVSTTTTRDPIVPISASRYERLQKLASTQ